MPIFEYACTECGSRFEKLVRSSDTNAVACPSCGKAEVTKQLSVFAAATNGSTEPAPRGGCPAGMCRTPDICGRN